jgi:hypothetical protein
MDSPTLKRLTQEKNQLHFIISKINSLPGSREEEKMNKSFSASVDTYFNTRIYANYFHFRNRVTSTTQAETNTEPVTNTNKNTVRTEYRELKNNELKIIESEL